MAEVVVGRYPDGIRGRSTLELSGETPNDLAPQPPKRIVFHAFAIDWLDADGRILFHFNPRPDDGIIVLNSFLDDAWGEQVVIPACPFPREEGVAFRLRFEVRRDGFHVSVDGRRLCRFAHRAPPSQIREVRSTAFLWRLDARRGLGRRGGRGRAVMPEVVSPRPPAADGQWVRQEEQPEAAEPLADFRLFAIICTWMEEDVVGATIASCFRQGCDGVYLVDNASPDATVARAAEAGAVPARSFESERFDDSEKTQQMQVVVDEVSARESADHIWWLWVDADEFYHGPGGLTLRDYLASLDRRFRIVGARFFQHLPSRQPLPDELGDPRSYQPLSYEIRYPMCAAGHYKHALHRLDKAGSAIRAERGFHRALSLDLLQEPAPVYCHHFPYREEAATRRRFNRLFGLDGSAPARAVEELHMELRRRSIDAIYRQRWHEVSFFPPCARGYVPELRPFDEWVGPEEAAGLRALTPSAPP